jgi:hypothetical protein
VLARVCVLGVGSRREDLREENINFEDGAGLTSSATYRIARGGRCIDI